MQITQLQSQEASVIHSLQECLRTPFLDQFFIGWSYLDSFGFAIVLITLVWQLISKSQGIKIFYILLLSGAVNHTLKEAFGLPRPCHIDPALGILCLPSYGFPSGAAQTAILLMGITFIETKNKLLRALATVYAVLLCFSRIYLGVHYFSDVVGGMLAGALLVLIYVKVFPYLKTHRNHFLALFPVCLLLIGGFSSLLFFSITLGMELGLLASKRKETRPSFLQRCIQALVIICGLFALSMAAVFTVPLTLIFGFIMGVWLSYLGEWSVRQTMYLARKINL